MAHLLSVVIPVFNEKASIERLHERLRRVLDACGIHWEVWYVDDGSVDGTGEWIVNESARDARVHGIELSRNFGHQAALAAGLETAAGDVVIVMDGDGQHPPELIPKMLDLHGRGFDIVLTERSGTKDAGMLKTFLSGMFYRILSRVSDVPVAANAADFRLMSRAVVNALNRMPEYHKFLRGMVSWLGFRAGTLEYEAGERIAGETKYGLRQMMTLANHALFSFSLFPLKLCVACGVLLLLLSAGEALFTVWIYFSPRRAELVPGWSSLMFFLLGIGGAQLLMLGVIGYYIGYIFEEVKRRPVYVIRRILGSK